MQKIVTFSSHDIAPSLPMDISDSLTPLPQKNSNPVVVCSKIWQFENYMVIWSLTNKRLSNMGYAHWILYSFQDTSIICKEILAALE